jgi:hypothetical protein
MPAAKTNARIMPISPPITKPTARNRPVMAASSRPVRMVFIIAGKPLVLIIEVRGSYMMT